MSEQNADLGATQKLTEYAHTEVIGTLPAGSAVSLIRGRMVIAGPTHKPYYLNQDGTTEEILP